MKKEPDSTQKGRVAQRKAAEKLSGRGPEGKADKNDDKDVKGEVDSSVEEPKSKRAHIQIGPTQDLASK